MVCGGVHVSLSLTCRKRELIRRNKVYTEKYKQWNFFSRLTLSLARPKGATRSEPSRDYISYGVWGCPREFVSVLRKRELTHRNKVCHRKVQAANYFHPNSFPWKTWQDTRSEPCRDHVSHGVWGCPREPCLCLAGKENSSAGIKFATVKYKPRSISRLTLSLGRCDGKKDQKHVETI